MPTSTNRTRKTATPATPVPTEIKEENMTDVAEVTPETVSEDTTPELPYPQYFETNPIFIEFAKKYIAVVDEINAYNKEVLAEKSSEWNSHKIFEKARELARPTAKDAKPVDEVKSALENFEALTNEINKARRAVLEITAKEIGITLNVTAERNPEVEAPLKEKRKFAVTIGSQLSMLAEMTADKNATTAFTEFLARYPLPQVGRDQTSTFGGDGNTTSTPKYRVTVQVFKGDDELLNVDGFTKAKLALTKDVFGYERGKALTAEKLREAWEKSGNTPEKTVTSPVQFEDNGLTFVITKKQ